MDAPEVVVEEKRGPGRPRKINKQSPQRPAVNLQSEEEIRKISTKQISDEKLLKQKPKKQGPKPGINLNTEIVRLMENDVHEKLIPVIKEAGPKKKSSSILTKVINVVHIPTSMELLSFFVDYICYQFCLRASKSEQEDPKTVIQQICPELKDSYAQTIEKVRRGRTIKYFKPEVIESLEQFSRDTGKTFSPTVLSKYLATVAVHFHSQLVAHL